MDSRLRAGLWNLLNIFYFHLDQGDWINPGTPLKTYVRQLWIENRWPLETLSTNKKVVFGALKGWFDGLAWNEAYDFIELTTEIYPIDAAGFRKACNDLLEEEMSGYRFVGTVITPITSPDEVAAIEEALSATSQLKPVHRHLEESLRLLSDRGAPDYRNSVKESISAVEALCAKLTGNPKATLGGALKGLGSHVSTHPALNEAFQRLYGWTSDADGIRHALMDDSTVESEDARFMLVSCSAFINYLLAKAARSDTA